MSSTDLIDELRISPAFVGIGAGGHSFEKDTRARFRAAVADPASGAQLAAIAEQLEQDGFEIGGERYVRIPHGMDSEGRAVRSRAPAVEGRTRRGRDSNPRSALADSGFQDRRFDLR